MVPEKFIINGLQDMYSEEISELDLCDASDNLLGFMELLVEIDLSQKQ